MNWYEVGDVAAFVSIVVVGFTFVSWLARKLIRRILARVQKWIMAQLNVAVEEITQHLTNDQKSVAVYAHEARDAARESKEAALESKEAALAAKDVSMQAANHLDSLASAMFRIENLIEEKAQNEEDS